MTHSSMTAARITACTLTLSFITLSVLPLCGEDKFLLCFQMEGHAHDLKIAVRKKAAPYHKPCTPFTFAENQVKFCLNYNTIATQRQQFCRLYHR